MKAISALLLAAALVANDPAAAAAGPSGIELERLADEVYQPPGVPGIFIIEQTGPVPCQGRVLFTGVTDVSVNTAIYAASSAGIEVVANLGTPIPGTPWTFYPEVGSSFAGFDSVIDCDAGLVFSSLYSQGRGVFLARDDGAIVPLVVPGDVTAEGDTLAEARFPSGGGALLTFIGRTAANPLLPAIFVRRPDGEIRRILGIGDVIEGRQISNVLSGADDRDVAIWTQSSTGGTPNVVIYRASFAGDALAVDVPSLSLSSLAVLSLLLAAAGLFCCLSRGGGGPA